MNIYVFDATYSYYVIMMLNGKKFEIAEKLGLFNRIRTIL